MPQSPTEHSNLIEIIPRRFYWTARRTLPKDTASTHFFSTDATLTYEPFSADFGPLSLAMTYRYCKMVEAKLNNPSLAGKCIIHVCLQDPEMRANAACLVGLYQVIMLRKTAKQAYQPFAGIEPPFHPFRDAITGPSTFDLTIPDCLEGMQKAIELGWFDIEAFDLESYEVLGNVYQCDASWVVPDKFLAFAGPSPNSSDASGYPCFTPEDCVPIFRRAGIGIVVRLNNKQYDRRRFTEHGIRHADLFFADGSCPPWEIISKFLLIAESEPGPVAVHCKAGLGRTCTLIGLYAMKHFHFPARAFIGWNRICRPGSVLGPQQQFLVNMQEEMFQLGRLPQSPKATKGSTFDNEVPSSPQAAGKHLLLTRAHQHKDIGQGERLCSAKRGSRGPLLSAVCGADDRPGSIGPPSPKAKLPPLTRRPMVRQASAPDLGYDRFKPLDHTQWSPTAGFGGKNVSRTCSR
mmetsp:Transcript_107766/g.300364  ORF Transcript_107766/g.300364 Transcript_107766/m.300364 type:complete len:462 (+) Transcript_107766:27-1412(+)